jgi:hypothetical protein
MFIFNNLKIIFNIVINFITNIILNIIKIYENIKNIIYYYPYIIAYLPFFENPNGATDYYYVHIRVGWMEWVVYKYSYDIILDQYVLAYLIFLYFQFLVILPIYYLYVIKHADYITTQYPDLDQVVFFQRFNLIIDIFLFIDFIILMSFYYYWPMSALSHALFYKVLTKSLFAWAIILFIFYYQLNLTILAIFFVGYSWRQVIVILTQFSIFNAIIYLIWCYYHDSYSVKIGVLIAFHVFHAYAANGWNAWYTEYDFEDIWRLGPEFEGWVFWHEYLEARKIRKDNIKKIHDYERQEYLKRRKKRLEEAEQRKQEKQKLREEGKLTWYVIWIDNIWNIIVKIYRYFAYYDKELAIKAEQAKKKAFADSLQSFEFQDLIIKSYFKNVHEYYRQQYTTIKWKELQDTMEQEWYDLTRNEQALDKFYDLFGDITYIEKEILSSLKESHKMHIMSYVLDKTPMTFNEFLESYDDPYNLVIKRKRLVVTDEDYYDVRKDEWLRDYEQLLKCDENEIVSFLRLNIRYLELLTRFHIRYSKDFSKQIKWNQYYFDLIWQAYEVLALYNKSIKYTKGYDIVKLAQDNFRAASLLTQQEIDNNLLKKEQVKQSHLFDIEIIDFEQKKDFIEKQNMNLYDFEFFVQNINNKSDLTMRQSILNYDANDMFEDMWDQEDLEEEFLDYYTEQENLEQEQWEESLKTNTFEKWKQMEEENDYFKYTNFQKVLWWYDIELHIISAYLFYWILSYDPFWFALGIYGHSNILSIA